ncbi:MAG TPA: hypothetical protein VK607_18290 [Kofleriaceae bacterium]|nr:hypothetical protein [Kofleriaceae bacterium]
MKLVEAESTGPVEGDAALVTPPRPPHRRVSVSLVFTLTVLVGTVVTIYAMFPARHNVLMTEAIAHHGDPGAAWDLAAPGPDALRAWLIGAVGVDAPLPGDGSRGSIAVIGARQLDILNRTAALIRVRIGDDDVSYLVQRARGIAPEGAERVDGALRAVAWRSGRFTVVAVGPDASATSWRAVLHPPRS